MADGSDRPPTHEEVVRVRRHECLVTNHSWEVIEEFGRGPVLVVCSNCGQDSGLRPSGSDEREGRES